MAPMKKSKETNSGDLDGRTLGLPLAFKRFISFISKYFEFSAVRWHQRLYVCFDPRFFRKMALVNIGSFTYKYLDTEPFQHCIARRGPFAWLPRSLYFTFWIFYIRPCQNCKTCFNSVQIQSLPHGKAMIEQATATVNTNTLGRVLKNINSRTNHTKKLKGGYTGQYITWIIRLEYPYYNIFWKAIEIIERNMIESSLLQIYFKRLKHFWHTLHDKILMIKPHWL